jgi:YedE family putative selenium metabolism protein
MQQKVSVQGILKDGGMGVLRKIKKVTGSSTTQHGPRYYSKSLFVLTGAAIGVGGVMLSFLGNPPNTGFCVSCFMENIAGSIGLHGNTRMQYLRPEIIGFVIGSFLMAVYKKKYKASGGSSPLLRYLVGILLIVGCAVFMGCPIKMVLRIAAGDLTAWIGVGGLAAGVYIGIRFLASGFSLGKPTQLPDANTLLMPALMALLLAALFWKPVFISLSSKGSGAQYAPAYLSLLAGLGVGALAQRTGFCITGGFARLFERGPRETALFPKSTGHAIGIGSFFLFALLASILTGQFSLGWHGQPSSNESHVWNFLGMVIVGFGSVLIRGCPFRQLIRAGQGDTDAGASVLGMLTGAALVQNWGLAGNAEGTPYEGKVAVLFGLCALFIIGLLYRNRGESFAPGVRAELD